MIKKNKKLFYFGILVCFFCLLGTSSAFAQSVQLWITKDFSQELILQKEVSFTDESVMDILRKNTAVETAYAGGFVTAINGVHGKDGKDWVYYVNGTLAGVGALQYFPKKGDNIWWDYHRWNDAVYFSSVIGAYPHPFLGGYEGGIPKTIIIADAQLMITAQALRQSLIDKGVASVEVVENNASAEIFHKDLVNRIFIGSWTDLQSDRGDRLIQDIVKFSAKGFSIRLDEEGLHALDIFGNSVQVFKNASAILSIGFPLWIITGTSNEEVEKAVKLLISHSERIKFFSGVVLSDDKVINVPVFPSE